jgi:hypothetical protein
MPAVRYEEIRSRYATVCEQKNPMAIAGMVAEQVGLCDGQGQRYFREGDGAPTVNTKSPRKPSDFRFDILAEAIIGRGWQQALGMERSDFAFPQGIQQRVVQEEAAAPIGPSVWANVAAWSATVGGLLGAQFNLGYETAPFDVADLFPIKPAVFWNGGQRYIDILGPYQPAQATGPGEQYPDNSMYAMWVEPGPLTKYAGMVAVTREALEIDISGGQILSQANTGGATLKFRENELSLDIITGQTNNYKLGFLKDTAATGYNTYAPTITSPAGVSHTLTNDIVNPLNDLGAFQTSDEAALLFHPVTNYPLDINLNTVLLPTPLAKIGQWLNGVSAWNALNQTTVGPAQPAPGQFPNAQLPGPNPWQGVIRPVVSRWLDYRQTLSTMQTDPNVSPGLGLSGAARYRWYRLDPSKFAARFQKWGPQSQAINATDWTMLTQGIAAGFVWDMATMVNVLSPYHIQRNKGV